MRISVILLMGEVLEEEVRVLRNYLFTLRNVHFMFSELKSSAPSSSLSHYDHHLHHLHSYCHIKIRNPITSLGSWFSRDARRKLSCNVVLCACVEPPNESHALLGTKASSGCGRSSIQVTRDSTLAPPRARQLK